MGQKIQFAKRAECNNFSAMAQIVDPAFKTIPKNSTAFLIWRVEKMELAPLPKDQYGNFYDGDSYIIYAASEHGTPSGVDAKVHETKTGLEIHIHFWLGEATSIDEMGVATIKTVELDDFLGGHPIQHREVQGNESDRFKAYFPTGLRTMKGGVATGFNVITDEYEPRLFRVKGRKNPTVTQMPSISWEHFNSGDIFVLDTKDVVFVWVGKQANHAEKVQGARTAQRMKDEHDAGAIVFLEDGKEKDLPKSELAAFEQFLKMSERTTIKTAEEAGEDEQTENKSRGSVKLYHCSDEDGTYKVTEVKSGPILQTDLNSNDSFIVDNGTAGIWVWVGKKASSKERTEAMRNAHGFVTKKGYPENTRVTKVIDQGEPTEFKLLFSKWVDKSQVQGFGKQNTVGRIATTVHTKFDAASLHSQPQLAADSQLVDDGSATKQVWRLENFELAPVPANMYGLFFSGDTYLIQYTYTSGTTEKYILYYWLGDHCAIDERGAIAMRTVEKDTALGGAAVQVRVVQGKEPAHFLAMFRGKMVIFNGGVASAFDGEGAEDRGIPPEFLLQVRGNGPQNTRAVEVDLEANSLNSNDVFVLRKTGNNYVWCGKGSNGDERESAKLLADFAFKADYQVVQEGQEKEDFWKALGGKKPYADSRLLAEPGDKLPPRLFQCSNATGNFKAEEILNFVQTDLAQEDVMLLDAREAIFIWIGKDSNDAEKKLVVETALEYLKSDPTKRDVDTPIMQVKQGFEPPTFTGFFGVWDDDLWKDSKSFDELRKDMTVNNDVIVIDKAVAAKTSMGFDDAPKFPLAELLVDNELLPEAVDKGHKEHHLSHADFRATFGLDHAAFVELPSWKQIKLKKDAKLF